MKVHFLYEDKDWVNVKKYSDAGNIVQDLGLKTIFSISAKEIVYKDGKVDYIEKEDPFLSKVMEAVMMTPLQTQAEIVYRQEMLKDAFAGEEFVYDLYECVDEMLKTWDTLGRRVAGGSSKDSAAKLISDIYVLKLFVTTLSKIKSLFKEELSKLHAAGFLRFYERLCADFSEEKETALHKILEDISFYTKDVEAEQLGKTEIKQRIVLGCNLVQGLKCNDFVVEEISTRVKNGKGRRGVAEMVQGYMMSQRPEAISLKKDVAILKKASDIEYEVVRYVVSACTPFVLELNDFFDQLRFQLGFYKAAIILRKHIGRFYLPYCYPEVGSRRDFVFEDLKEFVMAVEQRVTPVGNTCDILGSMLLVVTGANQGGKSTFLRSIGIAQIMMQCGLPVIAQKYVSGIFPSFFTHFTRREDSAMNSGRLDEELKRMSQIVDNLRDSSMVLLNESFATTTEKEGSMIAYDIIKAFTEAGVKVLTVTHLLSFAQRIYDEAGEMESIGVEFFSAQREDDGRRTFKMVQHEPELTSFGMDLYHSIIG